MKYCKPLYIVFCITALVLFPQTALAETSVDVSGNGPGVKTNVNVQTNTGQNTICQNGECTTSTPTNGVSKVCVNGECHTSTDGNFNYKSADGNTKININNSSSTNNSTKSSVNTSVNINTNTSSNESQKIDEEKSQIKENLDTQKKKLNEQKKIVEENQNAIQKLIDELKNFLKNLHLF